MGFELNPYDLCVANKMINGSQCMIVFYVDDNKISHNDPAVVDSVINELKKYFGELTVEKGNKFDFLGMNVHIRKEKKVVIEMRKHIEDALDWFGENIQEKPVTPANKNLFVVDNDSKALNTEKSDLFHSIVAMLQYVCKRARPDIETTIAFFVYEIFQKYEG